MEYQGIMELAFLFHMYQPPWQKPKILKKVSDECYSWLTKWIAENDLKIMLNINYSLTELLEKNNFNNIIQQIKEGADKNRIEFVGSSAYHAILPLLPGPEIFRQIKLNEAGNRKAFGGSWNPKGFFPPEMGYSPKLSEILKKTGYEWTITDDIVYTANETKKLNDSIAVTENLPIFFRNNYWSNKFSIENPKKGNTNAELFIKDMFEKSKKDYLILAFDIETIGHHQDYNAETMYYIKKTMDSLGIKSVFISELLEKYPKRKILVPDENKKYEGSWSTTPEDIKRENFYPLWKNSENKTHQLQWELIYHGIGVISRSDGDEEITYSRNLLDRGMNSCQMWWANKNKSAKPEYVLDSARLVLDSVRNNSHASFKDKSKAENLYKKIEGLVV